MQLPLFEKSFYPPAVAVNQSNGGGGQIEVIGQENQSQPSLWIAISDVTHGFGVAAARQLGENHRGKMIVHRERWSIARLKNQIEDASEIA